MLEFLHKHMLQVLGRRTLVGIGLVWSLNYSFAAQNPFERSEEDFFTGRYKGPNLTLSLRPQGSRWSGRLVQNGVAYKIDAGQKDGAIQGVFVENNDSNQKYSFALRSANGKLEFQARSFNCVLEREKHTAYSGRFRSARVEIGFYGFHGEIGDGHNQIDGRMTVDGKSYYVSARDIGGDLEGVYKSGGESHKFEIRTDTGAYVFKNAEMEVVLLSDQEETSRTEALAQQQKNADSDRAKVGALAKLRALTSPVSCRPGARKVQILVSDSGQIRFRLAQYEVRKDSGGGPTGWGNEEDTTESPWFKLEDVERLRFKITKEDGGETAYAFNIILRDSVKVTSPLDRAFWVTGSTVNPRSIGGVVLGMDNSKIRHWFDEVYGVLKDLVPCEPLE